MAGLSHSKKDNAVRTRDNQRRCRARRKAYLQELQEKHRVCEEMGIEASAEVLDAAKRVLRENKRLRDLLQARNIPQTEVDWFIGDGQLPADPTAVATLQQVMRPRKPPQQAPCTGRNTYERAQSLQPTPTVMQCPGSAMPVQVKQEMDRTPLNARPRELNTSMAAFPSMLTNTGYDGYGWHNQRNGTDSDTLNRGNLTSVVAQYERYLEDPWSYPPGSTKQQGSLA